MSRNEEIEAAAEVHNSKFKYDVYRQPDFSAGAKWADTHPSPEVLALVRALQDVVDNRWYNYNRCVTALANFQKARGEVKS